MALAIKTQGIPSSSFLIDYFCEAKKSNTLLIKRIHALHQSKTCINQETLKHKQN
jgi:hypothetical protein